MSSVSCMSWRGYLFLAAFVLILATVQAQSVSQDALIWRASKSARPEVVSFDQLRQLAISIQQPHYPFRARRQRLTGKGGFEVRVDQKTGKTTRVVILQSTGSTVLDQAAIEVLSTWRFKPGTVSRIQLPITYRL